MKKFWTVIIILVVIAVLGYGGYRVYHHYARLSAPIAQTQPVSAKTSKPAMAATQNAVYKMTNNAKLGNIMTDLKGFTLYTYAVDKPGVSNCSGQCLIIWPAYTAPSQTGTFPANISVIKRSDGSLQYAWKGMPLYYYMNDKKAGEVNGNGFKGVWSVVK